MKIILWIVALTAAALIGVSLWARLAPSPASRWNPDIAAAGFVPADGTVAFCPAPGSRYASGTPPSLDRLDAIALAWPRTTRLAWSEQDGEIRHITWITRTAIFGFPDYTTAQIRDWNDTRDICVIARQRFGTYDGGVNARRLEAWIQELYGLDEPPDLGWPPA